MTHGVISSEPCNSCNLSAASASAEVNPNTKLMRPYGTATCNPACLRVIPWCKCDPGAAPLRGPTRRPDVVRNLQKPFPGPRPEFHEREHSHDDLPRGVSCGWLSEMFEDENHWRCSILGALSGRGRQQREPKANSIQHSIEHSRGGVHGKHMVSTYFRDFSIKT